MPLHALLDCICLAGSLPAKLMSYSGCCNLRGRDTCVDWPNNSSDQLGFVIDIQSVTRGLPAFRLLEVLKSLGLLYFYSDQTGLFCVSEGQ